MAVGAVQLGVHDHVELCDHKHTHRLSNTRSSKHTHTHTHTHTAAIYVCLHIFTSIHTYHRGTAAPMYVNRNVCLYTYLIHIDTIEAPRRLIWSSIVCSVCASACAHEAPLPLRLAHVGPFPVRRARSPVPAYARACVRRPGSTHIRLGYSENSHWGTQSTQVPPCASSCRTAPGRRARSARRRARTRSRTRRRTCEYPCAYPCEYPPSTLGTLSTQSTSHGALRFP